MSICLQHYTTVRLQLHGQKRVYICGHDVIVSLYYSVSCHTVHKRQNRDCNETHMGLFCTVLNVSI